MNEQSKGPPDEPASAAGRPQPDVETGPADGVASNPRSARHRAWWFGLLLITATFLAYLPALHGGFVWDDASWTTNLTALFQNASGLHWIWFQPTALQQYYPLTGTTFWLDYQFWKFWTLPYHVENVLLHALAALLFWRLLVRLQLPGAWLAAALFALHPVMVESVAWITERKNVLSLALYLGALLAYLCHAQDGDASGTCRPAEVPQSGTKDGNPTLDSRPSPLFYGLAFVLFLCALLAKTTAFSLPAVILLLGWWKRGQIRWRADVLPTLPFFGLSIGLCAVTAWLEKNHVGAQGPVFDLTFPQRCLVAGRAFWFYPGHLFWPANLCFIYPRWQPDPGLLWQWLYPVTAIGILFILWLTRERIGRGPVTAVLFYAGTLFPLLGFMDAYGMRYSFVWDHWVYLSTLGIFALVAALVARAGESRRRPVLVYGFAAIVLPGLALLTWRQCGMYADIETLWRKTLIKNPDCWMAQNNLGAMLVAQGKPVEAEMFYREALPHTPDYAESLNNIGIALAAQGKLTEAIPYFDRALRLKPDYAEAHYNMGIALANQRKWAEALPFYEQALRLKPDYAEAHLNLGIALATQRKWAEASLHYERVLQLKPRYPEAHYNLGVALATQGKLAEAIPHFDRALQLKPNFANAHLNLAIALSSEGKTAEAIPHFQQALTLATAQGHTALAEFIRTRFKSYLPAAPQPQTP
jgi:tetratricopeptide (TPR) repeat protein